MKYLFFTVIAKIAVDLSDTNVLDGKADQLNLTQYPIVIKLLTLQKIPTSELSIY